MTTPNVKVLNVKPVHSGRVVNLRLEEIELPGGRRTTLELIRHPGAAAIVPVLPSGEVLLVRQYRHAAAGSFLLEVPAGTLNPGESPEECAKRECAEESGFRPGRLEPLGWLWTTPGFTDERIWLYLALELEPAAQALDDDELLSVERLPLARALDLALRGGIDDGKSITALVRASFRLGVSPSTS